MPGLVDKLGAGYRLTARGKSLRPMPDALHIWEETIARQRPATIDAPPAAG